MEVLMEESQRNEAELNQEMQRQEALEQYKLAVADYVQGLESKGFHVGGVKFSYIPISENFSTRELSCLIEVKKGSQTRYLILGSDLGRIGQISEDGKIMLEEEYKLEEQKHLKEKGFEKYDDLDQPHYLQNDEKGDLEAVSDKEHEEVLDKDEEKLQEVKQGLGKDLGTPLRVVELDMASGREYAKLNNVQIDASKGKILLVQYPGNIWITAQEQNGEYKKVSGLECSELNRDMVAELNIGINSSNARIKSGDIEAGDKDETEGADLLLLKRTGSQDMVVVNYNRWAETDIDLVNRTSGHKIELIDATAEYPTRIRIDDEIIEITEKEEIELPGLEDNAEEELGEGTERTLWENNPYGE